VGVELAGDYADLLENNTITNNANNGVLGFEFPNGGKLFQLSGNAVQNNKFSGNGTAGGELAGDATIEGGVLNEMGELVFPCESVNNCFAGNHFAVGRPSQVISRSVPSCTS
jgi:hypothetical protein